MSVSVGSLIAKPNKPNFKGNSEGTSSVPGVVSADVFETTSVGTCIGSHLGKGTYTGASEQDWSEGLGYGVVSGSITFTAANGDTLCAVADADVSRVYEVAPNNFTTYTSTIIYEITSGTGKFAAATGTFTSEIVHTRPDEDSPSVDVGSWSGTINMN